MAVQHRAKASCVVGAVMAGGLSIPRCAHLPAIFSAVTFVSSCRYPLKCVCWLNGNALLDDAVCI